MGLPPSLSPGAFFLVTPCVCVRWSYYIYRGYLSSVGVINFIWTPHILYFLVSPHPNPPPPPPPTLYPTQCFFTVNAAVLWRIYKFIISYNKKFSNFVFCRWYNPESTDVLVEQLLWMECVIRLIFVWKLNWFFTAKSSVYEKLLFKYFWRKRHLREPDWERNTMLFAAGCVGPLLNTAIKATTFYLSESFFSLCGRTNSIDRKFGLLFLFLSYLIQSHWIFCSFCRIATFANIIQHATQLVFIRWTYVLLLQVYDIQQIVYGSSSGRFLLYNVNYYSLFRLFVQSTLDTRITKITLVEAPCTCISQKTKKKQTCL